jgi:hypothetical protein
MPEPYKVKCLDARYDPESGFLVLNCLFVTMGELRVVCFHKSDFHYKNNPIVPDVEMSRTAMMFRNKKPTFNLLIEDDPNRNIVDDKNYVEHVQSFTTRIESELGQVSEGLVNETGLMSRKLGKLMDEGKLDAKQLLKNELAIRAKLGQPQ